MQIEPLSIDGLVLVRPQRHGDARGWFAETYHAARFGAAGIAAAFIQDNQALSAEPFTLRGLHAQAPPHAQAKLVRVLRGRIFDVAVDARVGSASYGRWVGVELSAQNASQLFVPAGFLHGYITLEPETEVAYKTDAYYAPQAEIVVAWNDPDLAIHWPVEEGAARVSARDRAGLGFTALQSPFRAATTPG